MPLFSNYYFLQALVGFLCFTFVETGYRNCFCFVCATQLKVTIFNLNLSNKLKQKIMWKGLVLAKTKLLAGNGVLI